MRPPYIFCPLLLSPSYIWPCCYCNKEESILHRCRARASERGLSALTVHASLELARRLAYQHHLETNGDGCNSFVPEDNNTYACGLLFLWDSIDSAGRMPVFGSGSLSSPAFCQSRVSHLTSYTASLLMPSLNEPHLTDNYTLIISEVMSILDRQNIAVSGLWDSTGHASLASLSEFAVIYRRGLQLLYNELDSVAMKKSHIFFYGSESYVWNNCDSSCCKNEYANLLNHGDWVSSLFVLNYTQGSNTLLANCALFPCPMPTVSSGSIQAVKNSLIFLMQSAHLCHQSGNNVMAKICTQGACWLATRHKLLFHHGCNLLQLSLIILDAAPIQLCTALLPLLECLELSERSSMNPLRALALLTLTKVFLYMGGEGRKLSCHKGRAVIRVSMPLVMQHSQAWFQGEAFLNLAKTYLAEATGWDAFYSSQNHNKGTDFDSIKKYSQHDSITIQLRKRALAELNESFFFFQQTNDILRIQQVHYLQARVCHMLLNTKKNRDYAAAKFIGLWDRFGIPCGCIKNMW